MKTRRSNLMVGSVALAAIGAAFVAHLVLQKVRSAHERTQFRITFEGSASGLRKGGAVNFDGVQVGEILSLKLENPRKIVALATIDNNAPIRKDTVAGLEFQGLTGVAAISLVGGSATAAPVPLDPDGIPTLTADLRETETIRDSLHHVDRILLENRTMVKDSLLSFETYTASLASKGQTFDRVIQNLDGAFVTFDDAMSKIDNMAPGFTTGKADDLLTKVTSVRELAESFEKRSQAFMEEGRRTLFEISGAATNITRKVNGEATSAQNPRPPRRPRPNAQ
jgi:phospholipid/cholesterol/gamma-HCH transport system substrate-binding protein